MGRKKSSNKLGNKCWKGGKLQWEGMMSERLGRSIMRILKNRIYSVRIALMTLKGIIILGGDPLCKASGR